MRAALGAPFLITPCQAKQQQSSCSASDGSRNLYCIKMRFLFLPMVHQSCACWPSWPLTLKAHVHMNRNCCAMPLSRMSSSPKAFANLQHKCGLLHYNVSHCFITFELGTHNLNLQFCMQHTDLLAGPQHATCHQPEQHLGTSEQQHHFMQISDFRQDVTDDLPSQLMVGPTSLTRLFRRLVRTADQWLSFGQ